MKTLPGNLSRIKPTLCAALAVLTLALPATVSAAAITWATPKTIAADSDVSTNGGLVYAYDESGAAATVNTVTFAAGNSTTSLGGNVTISGIASGTYGAFGASGSPWSSLSSSYQTVLTGAAYGGTGAGTITLNNLVVGHNYVVQVWVDDSRASGSGRNATNSSANTVVMAYNSTGAAGGVGQYTIGTFTASASTQSFTLQANSNGGSTQINALQLRDLTTGHFSGAGGTNWDAATTADWSSANGGPYNQTWTAIGGGSGLQAFFEGTATNVSVNGPVSAGGVVFSTDGYTLGGTGTLTLGNGLITTGPGSDTIGTLLAGTAGLTKLGSGSLTLTGPNQYTGVTTVSGGTLNLPVSAAGAATVNSGGTLVLSGSNTLNGTLTCFSGGTVQLVANAANTSGNYSSAYNATNANLNIQNNGAVQLRADSDVTFGNMPTYGPQLGGTGGSGVANFDVNQVIPGNTNHTLSIYNSGTHAYNTVLNVTGGNGYTLNIGFIDNYNSNLIVNATSASLKLGWIQYCNGLTKNGAGTLTLGKPGGTAAGQTGVITVNAGTLKVGDPSTFTGAMSLVVNSNAVFDLNGTNATVSTVNGGANTATITDNSAGTGTAILTESSQSTTTATLIKDGPTRKVAINLSNGNSGTPPFNLASANTFSGGVNLLNSASGTRLNLNGAITGSPFGTGTITIGQAATDKAVIFASAANITLTNAVVVNTTLGSDVNGTFRVDAGGFTLTGPITANLADVQFGSYSGGVTNFVTGQISGPGGLHLANAYYSGSYRNKTLTLTLNNPSANPNNYAGTTTIDAYQILAQGAANQLPNGVGAGSVNDNGTLNLNGFNCVINDLNGTGLVDGISGTPTFTVAGNNSGANFSGVIQNTAGTLGLTKIGAGTQTLSGLNTYSGPTLISGGMLQVAVGGSSANSAVTVAGTPGNSATLGVSITDNTLQWTCAGLTVNNAGGSSGLVFNFGAVTPSTTTAPLSASGAVAFTTAPVITILGSSVPVGNYPLLRWGAGSAPSITGITLILPRVAGHLQVVGNTLMLDVTGGSTEPVSWAGGNGTWDVNNSANKIWQDSSSAPTYYQTGDSVVFDTVAGTGGTVTLNTNVSPLAITVNNATASYTITGTGGITGATALTESGGNPLTLATANNYTGPTTINQGTLVLSGSLNNSPVNVIDTLTETANGVIAGTIGVTNAGTTTLAGANTFNGGVTLQGGQLNINNGGSSLANSAIGTGPLTLAGSATIDNTSGSDVTLKPVIAEVWNGDLTYAGSANNLNLGSGAVTLGGDHFVTVAANNLTVAGPIGGAHALFKEGPGSLTFSNYNTYSGGTTVDAGTLYLGVGGGTGAIRNTLNINNNATVVLAHVDALGYSSGWVTTININSGTLTNASGGNEGYNSSFNLDMGTITSSGGSYVLANQTISSVGDVNASVISAPLLLRGTQLTLNASAGTTTNGIDLVLGGKLSPYSGETGALVNTGTGTVELSGTNTFTGPTTNSAGTLDLACPLALQASTLTLNGGAVVFDSVVTNDAFTLGGLQSATATGSGYDLALTNNAGAPVAVSVGANNASTTYADNLSDAGSLIKIGTGTLTLTTSSNSYGGGTLISGGTLALGTDYAGNENINALGAGNVTLTNGATLKFGGTGGYPIVYYAFPTANSFTFNNGALNVTDGGQILLGTLTVNSGGLTTVTHYIGKDLFLNGLVTGTGPINIQNVPFASNHQGYTHFGNASNTYAGTLNIVGPTVGNGGAVYLDANTALANATVVDNHSPSSTNSYYSVLAFNAGVDAPVLGALAGTGNFALVDSTNGPVTLTVGGNGATTVYAGALSGSGALTKTGNGTLSLTSSNYYTGNTTVAGGTLELALAWLATNSTVSVAAGATLQLDFATTNEVTSFVTNGVAAGPGVYNSTTAAPYITGPGSLLVPSAVDLTPTSLTATVTGNSLMLGWPADHTGWVLQAQTNTMPTGLGTNWLDIPGSATTNGATIAIDPSNPTVFFRLRTP